MKFSDFAQIIHSIVGGGKYNFTIELIKAGLDADGVEYVKSIRSDESGKSRIRKILSGKNDITEIAPYIINSYHQHLFVDYIIEGIEESSYPELCRKFGEKPYNVSMDIDDVPQRLAEIYEGILTEAAKGKGTIISSEEVNTSKEIIPIHHISKIEEILEKICYYNDNLFYGYEGQESMPSFQIEYGKYRSLFKQLIRLSLLYPFLKTLESIETYILTEKEFYILNADGVLKRSKFDSLVNEVLNELSSFQM